MKTLVKGNEAIVLGSLVAGCDAFFGYPITPASEIPELISKYFPKIGKVFIQAECEIGSIAMVYGAAACGRRAMTSSSGPGISLKQECISFIAGGEIPCVIVDIMRAGPGLGNIGAEQSDYFQVVKGGGHGGYKVIALAPNSVAEMYDFTIRAFELADKYRTPVYLLADATLGQIMEPIEIAEREIVEIEKTWRLDTGAMSNGNVVTSIFLDFAVMEDHVRHLNEKYRHIEDFEQDAEFYLTDDADLILSGYGIVSRILRSIVDTLRGEGMRIGLVRPKTLWPFPKKLFGTLAKRESTKYLVVELSSGQYVEDVRLSTPGREVYFYGRAGGNLPSEGEIIDFIRTIF